MEKKEKRKPVGNEIHIISYLQFFNALDECYKDRYLEEMKIYFHFLKSIEKEEIDLSYLAPEHQKLVYLGLKEVFQKLKFSLSEEQIELLNHVLHIESMNEQELSFWVDNAQKDKEFLQSVLKGYYDLSIYDCVQRNDLHNYISVVLSV